MNKKGISPLIATVLIIGFTIVIAFLVITWLTGRTEVLMCQESCDIVGLQVCSNSASDLSAEGLTDLADGVSIVNGGSETYYATVICYDDKGVVIGAGDEGNIGPYGSVTFDCTDIFAVDTVDAIKVIPSVTPVIEDCPICIATTCETIDI